jgi:uncharacterized iron-regulated protein
MMTFHLKIGWPLILVLCATGFAEPTSPRWQAPTVQCSISIRDGHTGQTVEWEALLEALAEADVVFLGEQHTDETSHRVQLAIYEELLARRQQRVVLALEMFQRDTQDALNAYLAGEIDEQTWLGQARPWTNYATAYRPLVETARRAGVPVMAANFPRPMLMRIAREGVEVLQDLTDEQRQHVPDRLLPQRDAYWRRVDNAMRGHAGAMRSGDRLHSTQSLWDNSMADTAARALDQHPDHRVLFINGDYHSAYGDGAVHLLRQRKPQIAITTVSLVPVANPSVADWEGLPVADFVVFVEDRARDQREGAWSVTIPRSVDYRFHQPASVDGQGKLPLLIVLVEDGLNAQDGLELWRERLGEQAAIAVLEPLHRQQQPDLSRGGRWFWPDAFAADLRGALQACERMWAYLCRHFPVDPDRVAIVGRGSGATVAAGIAVHTQRMDVRTVAWLPKQFAPIKDLPLPLPELWGDAAPPERSLRLAIDAADRSWWEPEWQAYREIGVDARPLELDPDPWLQEQQLEQAVREALGLPAGDRKLQQPRFYLVVSRDAPRQRHWARMQAQWAAAQQGIAVAVVDQPPDDPAAEAWQTEVPAEQFTASGRLPRCPGPFGGTTVVVLPSELPEAERQAWQALEREDPLAAASRFHRLRVATGSPEHTLHEVLTRLESEDRRNVLIVPGVFYADASWMRELDHSVRDFRDAMTLHWLPGLGGTRPAD